MLRRMLLALAAMLLLGGQAYASWSPQVAASLYYQSASDHYDAGDYQAALAEFQAGYAALPQPTFLVNIGQCLRKLDRLDEAAVAYKQFLDLRTGNSRVRGEVWEALDEVLVDLEDRLYKLAEQAMEFRKFLESGQGTEAERLAVRQRHDEIIARLMRVDDMLTLGMGRVHLLSLPSLPEPQKGAVASSTTRTTP